MSRILAAVTAITTACSGSSQSPCTSECDTLQVNARGLAARLGVLADTKASEEKRPSEEKKERLSEEKPHCGRSSGRPGPEDHLVPTNSTPGGAGGAGFTQGRPFGNGGVSLDDPGSSP